MVMDFDSEFGHYHVEDEIYNGRPARILYGGNKLVAQSGMARDTNDELIFDYNQRFRELIQGMLPKRVLVLGGGVLTLPTALIREFPEMHIDVVERDELLVTLAAAYFGYTPNAHMTIYIGDGVGYLLDTKATYDLIIMDVFDHAAIPTAFQTPAFMRSMRKHIDKRGVVAINCIAAQRGLRAATLHKLYGLVQPVFPVSQIFSAARNPSEWMSENYLVVGQDGTWDIPAYLLREPVKLSLAA